MRSSTIAAALAVPCLTSASPIATSLSPDVCLKASQVLSALNALSTVDKFCTSYLSITPRTATVTTTYTQPLTEVYGDIVSEVYASPAPPGTTTVLPNAVSGTGAGTVTVTSTLFAVSTFSETQTDTATTSQLCTTTETAAKQAVQTACDCIGVTTSTVTATLTETTTGDVIVVTTTYTRTVSGHIKSDTHAQKNQTHSSCSSTTQPRRTHLQLRRRKLSVIVPCTLHIPHR